MFKYISAGLTITLFVIGGIFYWYYKNSQETISLLNENNARLEIAVQTNEQTIESLRRDFANLSTILNTTNQELADARVQNRSLADRLARHDLGALAEQRPGLVQPRINNATANALRCFELLTGAPLTERERNATNAREFNSECPWLFDTIRP